MNGRDLLLSALAGQATPRPAWLPYVGVHGGHLIGELAEPYLRSASLIQKGLEVANDLYRPDGLSVVFDLQLEAEALGCELHWAEHTPPSVTTHPMSELEGEGRPLDALPAFSLSNGRFPIMLDAMARTKRSLGDRVALHGLLTGPLTLASHLLGNDLFMKMYDDPDGLKRILDYCAVIAMKVTDAYVEQGMDVLAVVDPMTSQISAEHFEQFVTPAVNKVFDHIRHHQRPGSLFVCGDATRNLQVMAATHCDHVAIDEQIPLTTIREMTRPAGKSFGGNLKLTTVLLMGTADDARRNALECMDQAGDQAFVLAPGCDLPYHVPPENLQAVAEMVHDPYQRDIARHSLPAITRPDTYEDVVLPDYAREEAVIVDVITLDSAACAPCQYMVAAVRQAIDTMSAPYPVQMREHKITTRQGVGMMVRLGVPNLPSICIDGKCAYASITPPARELAERLVRCAREKDQARARQS